MEKFRPRSSFDPVANCGALLSAVEVGLGSVLHAFHIPFSGHCLSLNQTFLLSRMVLKNKGEKGVREFPIIASNIAAVLKSLSPAGKKLSPMLALSAQGMLFGFGTMIAGPNLVGVILGSVFASFWAFLQPLLVYYLLFGQTIVEVVEYYYKKAHEVVAFEKKDLLFVLILILLVKAILSVILALLAARISDRRFHSFQVRMLKIGSPKRQMTFKRSHEKMDMMEALKHTLKDVFNPLFIFSLILTAVFFIYSEAGIAKTLWALLRPIALAFLMFFLFRKVGFDPLVAKLEKTRFKRFAASVKHAAKLLKEI
jgi:hypothetical protein